LCQHLPRGTEVHVAQELERLARLGFNGEQIGILLRTLAAERAASQQQHDGVELVWSGPEVPGAYSRDTGVVASELVRSAKRSVLLSTYVVTQGRQVFKPLAERMAQLPDLRVRLFLNVDRPYRSEKPDHQLLKEFCDAFRREQWPGERLPEVFYDPRALAHDSGPRAALHAKCIVIDEAIAFVTSANFTIAAQARNLEAGVVVRSASFAKALIAQFETLVAAGQLRRLPGS
jgi:phosphatidylserine/phosphatidylglycerophosphate/cardiolipin synthase-like enzyme